MMPDGRRVSFTVCTDWPCHSDEQEFAYMEKLSDPEFQEIARQMLRELFVKQLELPIASFRSVSMAEMRGGGA